MKSGMPSMEDRVVADSAADPASVSMPVRAETPRTACRVLYVIGSLSVGGAQKHLYDLIRSLPRDQYKPHVVVFEPGGFYTDKIEALGVRVDSLEIATRSDLISRFPKFLSLVRELQPDVLHLFLFHSSLYGAMAASLLGRPFVFSKRSMGLEISAFRRLVYRYLILARADAVTAVSEPVADECVRLGLPRSRVQVIENGIEWITDAPRGQLRRAIAAPADAPLVGTVGSMTWRKRQHLLLRAAPLILARRPDVHFVILGDGPLRDELTRERESLHLTEQVHLPGVLFPAPRYLGDLSVFTLMSSEEGTSNALLEAMMLGVPSVASDIPSNRAVLEHEATGLLVDPADATQFADAVLRILDQKTSVQAMAKRARERVSQRYQLGVCVATNAALYDSLVGSRRQSRE